MSRNQGTGFAERMIYEIQNAAKVVCRRALGPRRTGRGVCVALWFLASMESRLRGGKPRHGSTSFFEKSQNN